MVNGDSEEIEMDEPETEALLDKQVRALRITVCALIGGALTLALVVVFLRLNGFHVHLGPLPVISLVAVFQCLGSLAARPMVLNASLRGAQQRIAVSDSDSDAVWIPVFNNRTIVGAALLEGAAFMFFIAYLLEGQWWTLAGGLAMVAL